MKNEDNLRFFNQPQEADKWIWRVENGIGDWIDKEGGKQKPFVHRAVGKQTAGGPDCRHHP